MTHPPDTQSASISPASPTEPIVPAPAVASAARNPVVLGLRRERRRLLLRRILRNPLLLAGSAIFVIMLAAVFLGPFLLNQDPYAVDPVSRLQPPSAEHPMGTDGFGRDLLIRVLEGGRVSLLIGLSVTVVSSILALIVGLYSVHFPRLGAVLMRITDGVMAIPGLLLAIAIAAALGPSTLNVIIALSIGSIPTAARLIRSVVLVISSQTYVEALHALGAGPTRILWANVTPNLVPALVVQATFMFAGAILGEAGLSFVGAGVSAPAPSWGNILQEAQTLVYNAWWMVTFPGLALLLTVLSTNLVGEGLRALLAPKGK
jgi:peptide/nickel transport system permease protein